MTEPLVIPRTHWYGRRRWDGQRNCYPVCTPELRMRVPGGPAGVAAHDEAHERYGVDPPPVAMPTPRFPFDLDRAALRASPKKVFGHYYPAGPRSLDNKTPPAHGWRTDYLDPLAPAATYLDAAGRAKRLAMGGWVRNIPWERAAIAGDWRLADAIFEMTECAAVGIDGWFVNLMVVPPDPNWQVQVVDAAYRAAATDPGFLMVPQLDVSGSIAAMDKNRIGDYLIPMLTHPNAWRLLGRPVLGAFHPETVGVAWWRDLFTVLRSRGVEVGFYPQFDNFDTGRDMFKAEPNLVGGADWGDGDYGWNDPSPTGYRVRRLQAMNALGVRSGQPIRVQDYRPRDGLFQEAGNLENLRRTVAIAKAGAATDLIVCTLNDFTETSAVLPSIYGAFTFLDVLAPFIHEHKTAQFPTIVRDWIYLTHRRQLAASGPLDARQTLVARTKTTGTPGRDATEAMVALTSPADVEIWSGTNKALWRDVQPGAMRPLTTALGVGWNGARISRAGQPVVVCESPHQSYAALQWQDLQYVAAQNGVGAA